MRIITDKKTATVDINMDGITRACLKDIDAHLHHLQVFLGEFADIENTETGEFVEGSEIARVRGVLSSLLEAEHSHFKVYSAIRQLNIGKIN